MDSHDTFPAMLRYLFRLPSLPLDATERTPRCGPQFSAGPASVSFGASPRGFGCG